MIEIQPNLYVGDENSCRDGTADMAVVHACKHPCHQRAVGYSGNLSPNHPNYLVLAKEYDLFLNMIDPDRPLFKPPLFSRFLEFARKHQNEGRPILIHCNRGESRSPTLAMLFLAKVRGEIPDDSFRAAAQEFAVLYPQYRPGPGIQMYLTKHWNNFNTRNIGR